MGLQDSLKQRLDSDEFRFVKDRLSAAAHPTRQTVRGAIQTPSGDRIPAKVILHPAQEASTYSHVGEVPIPMAWVDEFEQDIRRFFFVSEEGECFSQIQVLELVDEDTDAVEMKGRIVLLRAPLDLSDAVVSPDTEAQPATRH